MAGHATITFSQTGVQPPVYVTTSINDWTPVEMDVNEDKTASDDLIFRKEFNDVAEGSYQYKIRVGEDHWVLDESKETAATDDGIRNNVIHVKVASENNSLKSAPEATTVQETPSEQESLKASLANPSKIPEDRKDSTMGDQLSSVPVSSMVVGKVEDQKQPAYGNTHHLDLPVDAAKRSADAEPDYEETKVDSPIKTETPKSPEIPLLVVDKTDDRPAYGDDFGEDATTAQKVAHDMRASDTQPDILTITPESHTEPGDTEDDQAAPLFRHESFQADDDESQAPPKITVDDESTQSSTDQTSSGDAMDTPPEPEDGDELNLAPVLSHETELRGSVSEARDGLQVSHEGNDDEDDVDESGGAPLLPHETGFTEDDGADTESDDERNELDRYPLLSHESGFSDYKRSETLTKSEHSENREPQHYGAYGNEDDDEGNRDAEDDDTPLLPHERESAFVSSTGSDFSQDDAPFSLEKQPTFGYETGNARELFGAADRHDFFRGRTGSNLPHRLPQSDAEDQDLNDPSLERFPTNRESILARVATIGMHLPEDESMHERPHSPQPSVLSQACSSIDLVPVKSYASLASVPEDENSDEDEGYHHDLDSMPSPVYISHNTTRRSSPPARFVRDPYAASLADDNEQLGDAFDTKIDEPGSHTQESSEAESVAKHDGAKDISVAHSALLDAISAPVNMAKSATELVTSEPKTTTSEAHPVSNLDSELRQRRAVLEESSQTEEEMPESAADDVSITDKIVEAAKPALAQRSDYRRDNFLQHLFRAMFAACFGDRKRASASALVLGTTAATYYYAAKASR